MTVFAKYCQTEIARDNKTFSVAASNESDKVEFRITHNGTQMRFEITATEFAELTQLVGRAVVPSSTRGG